MVPIQPDLELWNSSTETFFLQRTILFIFGTRPEAIKLSPLILRLRESPEDWRLQVCVTAQHRGMLDQVLDAFGIRPDYDLDIMQPGQTLFQSTSRILAALEPVFAAARPDLAFVQGDTTTTLCGAIGAFYAGVPVAHVEAGLRTGDLRQPFPEEINRVLHRAPGGSAFRGHQRGCATIWPRKGSWKTSGSRATPESTRCCTFATGWKTASSPRHRPSLCRRASGWSW